MKKFRNSILLSPHCDDVAFSLGALLLSGNFTGSRVMTVFTESSCTASNENQDIESVSALRKNEDILFFNLCPQLIEVIHLGFLDAPIRLGISEEEVCNFPILKTNSTDVMTKVRMHISSDDLILAPLALGNHIDHIIVRDLAIDLISEGHRLIFFEDLPYAGSLSTKQIFQYVDLLSTNLKAQLKPQEIKTNISIEDKVSACSKYVSQMEDSIIERLVRYHNQFDNNWVSERIWPLQNSHMNPLRDA